jgi:hypothetical protein
MTKIALIAGAIVLASSAAVCAGPKSAADPGASGYSPGDRMHDKGMTSKGGASQYAPGQNQRKPGGASELSPGDRMNDRR